MSAGARPLRIGIDAHGVGGHSQAPGNESHFSNLIAALLVLDGENEYHLFADHPEALGTIVAGRTNVRLVSLQPHTQWVQRPVSLPLYAHRHRLDILHTPFIRPPFVRARTVVTVHDISFEIHPEYYPALERWRMKALVPPSCRKADLVFTVSEYARQQIHEIYRVPRDKIVVTHNAADHMRAGANGAAPATLPPGIAPPYVLYAGMIQPRKNLVRLVQAFDRLKSASDLPHQLVLAGRWGWGNHELELALAAMRHRDAVHLPGYVSPAVLETLMGGAELFAFPSLFEGFGMPPLEAQTRGVPVLLPRSSCFPEIYGDSALYCDPLSVESIAAGLARLASDAGLRADLGRRGREHAGRYSWSRSAAVALEAYRRLGELGRRGSAR